jgi:hypothetical protein
MIEIAAAPTAGAQRHSMTDPQLMLGAELVEHRCDPSLAGAPTCTTRTTSPPSAVGPTQQPSPSARALW